MEIYLRVAHRNGSIYDSDDFGDGILFDKFGNPTEEMIRVMCEDKHDIGYRMTIEEFFAELDELREEAEHASNQAQKIIPAGVEA